ncbi:MAG TPA: hypothetical protein VH988_17605 [Thermoanaerobaculia bacterium]|nr:hypothetical protein [Thermoanaerobaculia bacterium]
MVALLHTEKRMPVAASGSKSDASFGWAAPVFGKDAANPPCAATPLGNPAANQASGATELGTSAANFAAPALQLHLFDANRGIFAAEIPGEASRPDKFASEIFSTILEEHEHDANFRGSAASCHGFAAVRPGFAAKPAGSAVKPDMHEPPDLMGITLLGRLDDHMPTIRDPDVEIVPSHQRHPHQRRCVHSVDLDVPFLAVPQNSYAVDVEHLFAAVGQQGSTATQAGKA